MLNTTTKLLVSVAGLSAIVGLSGCVSLDMSKPEETTPTSAEAPTSTPSDDESPEADATADPTKTRAVTLDSGADYARAVQAFSPYIELWTIDGDSIKYEDRNCVKTKSEGTGTLEPDEGGLRHVRWDGEESPLDPNALLTVDLEIDDEHLTEPGLPKQDWSVPDVEGQEKKFVEMCLEAGETVTGIG